MGLEACRYRGVNMDPFRGPVDGAIAQTKGNRRSLGDPAPPGTIRPKMPIVMNGC